MPQTILVIHSAGAQGPDAGSGPLIRALGADLGPGYDLRAPAMPDPENPSYAPWKARLAGEFAAAGGDLLLIGHSLGGSVLVKYLAEEGYVGSISGLFLVAAPYFGAPDWEHAEFMPPAALALGAVQRVWLYYTRDDAVVPFEHLALYARALPQAFARELDGYGHGFNAGCAELAADIRALGA